MKVSLMSDIHLEFCAMPPLPGGEVLLLSGDIMAVARDSLPLSLRDNYHDFFTRASAQYERIFYIMGNHEHYHGDFQKTAESIKEFIYKYPKVTFLNNEAVSLSEETMIFGATLWTSLNDSDPLAMNAAKNCMNDFRLIYSGDKRRFTVEDSISQHQLTKGALIAALADYPDKNFLVMTHHTPSWQSIHPKYGNDILNYAYSSDLSGLILDNPRIKHWTHGHTHDSFDYMIGECRVLCNPRGYARYKDDDPENYKFNINFNFEVK